MNRDNSNELMNILAGNPDHLGPSYAMLNAILMKAQQERRKADAKLTPEELMERERQKKLAEIRRLRKVLVMRGVCPDCEDGKGKLTRGKKSKAHGHQRLWKCSSCEHDYTWEGERV